MRNLSHILKCRLVATALSSVLLCAAAQAQTPTPDHTAHHPGQNAPAATPTPGQTQGSQMPMPQPSPAPTQGGQPAPGGMSGMMEGMGEMMKGMGSPPPKELYPTLMDLPEL